MEVGQTLKLPSNAVMPSPAFKPVADPDPGSHGTHRCQRADPDPDRQGLQTAGGHPDDLNAISDPNKVEVGTRLYLKSPDQTPHPIPAVHQRNIRAKATSSVQTTPSPVQTKTSAEGLFRPKNQPNNNLRRAQPLWPRVRIGKPMDRCRWTGPTGRPWVTAKWFQLSTLPVSPCIWP